MKRWIFSIILSLLYNLILFSILLYFESPRDIIPHPRYKIDIVRLTPQKEQEKKKVVVKKRKVVIKARLKEGPKREEERVFPKTEEVILEEEKEDPLPEVGGEIPIEAFKEDTEGIEETESPVFEIGDLDEPLRIIKSIKIEYPAFAYNKDLEGLILLKILVDPDGRPSKIEVISNELANFPSFLENTLNAVSKWQFSKPTIRGRPVSVFYYLPVRFTTER